MANFRFLANFRFFTLHFADIQARECFARSIELHKKTSLEEFPQRDVHIKQSLSSSAQSLCEDGNYEESYKLYQQVRQVGNKVFSQLGSFTN